VRHARRGGYVIAPLLGDRFLGTPRFFRELRWSQRLSDAGILTPRVLAGVWQRTGPVHRADVATERIDGSDLATLLFAATPPQGEHRRAILVAVARLVRQLHDAGIVHPDLQLRNVLVATGADGPAAALLDVDTCRAAGGAAAAQRNLRRFYRSWSKWNRERGERLTAGDRRAFEAAYAAAGPA
jgi:tRNA A-37 threonylcarbamoyl transferase component Bud32